MRALEKQQTKTKSKTEKKAKNMNKAKWTEIDKFIFDHEGLIYEKIIEKRNKKGDIIDRILQIPVRYIKIAPLTDAEKWKLVRRLYIDLLMSQKNNKKTKKKKK